LKNQQIPSSASPPPFPSGRRSSNSLACSATEEIGSGCARFLLPRIRLDSLPSFLFFLRPGSSCRRGGRYLYHASFPFPVLTRREEHSGREDAPPSRRMEPFLFFFPLFPRWDRGWEKQRESDSHPIFFFCVLPREWRWSGFIRLFEIDTPFLISP